MQQPDLLWRVATACLAAAPTVRPHEAERAAAALAASCRAARDSAGQVVKDAVDRGALRCPQSRALRAFLRHLAHLRTGAEDIAGARLGPAHVSDLAPLEHSLALSIGKQLVIEIDRTFMPPLIDHDTDDDEGDDGPQHTQPPPLAFCAMVWVWVKRRTAHRPDAPMVSSHACFYHDDAFEAPDAYVERAMAMLDAALDAVGPVAAAAPKTCITAHTPEQDGCAAAIVGALRRAFGSAAAARDGP